MKYDDKSDDSNEGDDSDVSENASMDGSLIESDVELDFDSSAADVERPSTPVPFWLRTDEDIPEVVLPPSSEDMLIPNELLLQVQCLPPAYFYENARILSLHFAFFKNSRLAPLTKSCGTFQPFSVCHRFVLRTSAPHSTLKSRATSCPKSTSPWSGA